jgi:formylglycine-generating enzyme required for sulfatase activity
MAPRSQRSVNISTPRAERIRRRKTRRNFFTFVVVQLLIAGVAFVFVRDYMSDGFTKQALANVLNNVTTAVNPPPELEAITKQEVAPVQEPAPAIEPEATPPVETAAVEAVDVPEVPQAEVQATPPAVEPEPVVQAAPPAAEPELQAEVQAAPPPVEPEPVPQAEVQATPPPVEPEPVPQAEVQATPPPVEPEPAPQVEEQVVAVVPVPDPAPSKAELAVVVPLQATGQPKREGQTFRDCETCPELVAINPGRFMMGPATEGMTQKARAAVEQEIAVDSPFAIGRYEITFDDWERCVTAGDCAGSPVDDGWGRGLRPVIHVSYNDVTEQYLPWLSKITGYAYRLPTEAEWELASRGGATAGMRQTLEVGSKAQISCNYGNSSDVSAKTREIVWAGVGCNDGFANTAPTGSFKPNSLGIFDMHGNVWEWVSDCWYATYASEEEKNAPTCKYHVLRGGSWSSEFRFLRDGIWVGDAVAYRAAVRGWETSIKARNSIGFRVARSQS